MTRPITPYHRTITQGAVGGKPTRVFPTTNVGNPFTAPLPNHGLAGIANRLVHRPTSAPMLPSAAFHTNAAWASQTIKGMQTVRFGGPITSVTHLLGTTHASLRRRVRRGT